MSTEFFQHYEESCQQLDQAVSLLERWKESQETLKESMKAAAHLLGSQLKKGNFLAVKALTKTIYRHCIALWHKRGLVGKQKHMTILIVKSIVPQEIALMEMLEQKKIPENFSIQAKMVRLHLERNVLYLAQLRKKPFSFEKEKDTLTAIKDQALLTDEEYEVVCKACAYYKQLLAR